MAAAQFGRLPLPQTPTPPLQLSLPPGTGVTFAQLYGLDLRAVLQIAKDDMEVHDTFVRT